jgi:hypothetical protein
VALIPIVSGLVQRFSIMAGLNIPWYQTFLNNYQGLLQRVVALLVFGPIAVSAWYLGRRLRSAGSIRCEADSVSCPPQSPMSRGARQ